MKKKIRILYLINHVTLSKFEIPMLLDMGYEVYMPKIPPFDISVRVDMELDKVLTVPMEEVSILNDTNFYDEPLNETCINIINCSYFFTVFNNNRTNPLRTLFVRRP